VRSDTAKQDPTNPDRIEGELRDGAKVKLATKFSHGDPEQRRYPKPATVEKS
jgi:hypothetical protein